MNKKNSVNFSTLISRQKSGVADFIAPPALEVTSKELNIGSKVTRTFFVISYPSTLTEGWLSPIINMDRTFDISISINPIDTNVALKDFRKKVAEVESQITVRARKGLVRDPKIDTAYQNLEHLRSLLQRSEERIFNVGLYITIYAKR